MGKETGIEHIEWNGKNIREVCEFLGASEEQYLNEEGEYFIYDKTFGTFIVKTPEGDKNAYVGHYIVKLGHGAFTSCKPNVLGMLIGMMS